MANEPQEATMRYSDWAVAFLDIIGFKKKVEKTESDSSGIADIANALWKARQWLDHFRGDAKDVEIQTFSDTTLICASEPTPAGIVSLILGIALYECSMVLNGSVLRGGLAVGPSFKSGTGLSGTTMFGPAIIEAYEAELVADWPRVVVASSVLRRVNPLASNWRTRPFIRMDERGLAYVDYLLGGCLQMTGRQWDIDYSRGVAGPPIMGSLISHHRDVIMALRHEARASVKELSRCHSLAAYHNSTITQLNVVLAGWQDEGALVKRGLTPYGTVFPPDVERVPGELAGIDQRATEFARERLKEAPELQDRLKGLVIDLPSAFPALYGS